MISAPFDEFRATVVPEWIDENQHLNMGYYVVAFDRATDAWLVHIGLDPDHRAIHRVTTFTLESHVNYLREVREGDPLRFTTQLLAFDQKRIHYIHQMYHGEQGYLAATNELMSLHVSLETRRAAPMQPVIQDRLARVLEAHSRLDRPPQVGRSIGL
ncbi:MAG: thioesterase family protein [Myxococcales bacterium]|nr:thioesterase family protein [Myxococcales bacterium]